VLGDDMRRPFGSGKQDAMLWRVALWGDRFAPWPN
jgi:hypothetical protein